MSIAWNQQQESLADIQKIIKDKHCPDDIQIIKEHIKFLKKQSAFYYACQLLSLARNKQRASRSAEESMVKQTWWKAAAAQDEVWIVQQLALCTYKDEELPARKKAATSPHLVGRNRSA